MYRRGLILTGGPIYTMDPDLPVAHGLMAFNGLIEYVGEALNLDAMGVDESAGAWLRVVDLKGRAVIPGMVGGSVDLMQTARDLGYLDLGGIQDPGVFLRTLRYRLEGMPTGSWLVGRKFDRMLAEKVPGLRERMDRLAPRNPVLLQGDSGSWAAANSLALRVGASEVIDGSGCDGIERKSHGIPTGIVKGATLERLKRSLPSPTQRRLEDLVENTVRQCLAWGWTTLFDTGGCATFGVLARLGKRTSLPLRTISTIHPEELSACLLSGVRSGFGNDFLRRGGLLVDLDREESSGSSSSSTAAPEELLAILRRGAVEEFPIHLRASSGHQFSLALRILEQIGPGCCRHRILGVREIDREDLATLASMNVGLSLELAEESAVLSDSSLIEWLVRHGVHLGLSPSTGERTRTPLEVIKEFTESEVAGVDEEGHPLWGMRLEDALWANVIEEHWGLGLDARLGRLAEGYLADLVILDRDPFRGSQGGGAPRILATACDGIVRYELPGWERD